MCENGKEGKGEVVLGLRALVRHWVGSEVLCGATGGFEQDDVIAPGEGRAEQPGSQR